MKRAKPFPGKLTGEKGAVAKQGWASTPRAYEVPKEIKAIDVDCPACKAVPQVRCTTVGGSVYEPWDTASLANRVIGKPTAPHPARQRMARRRNNELREAAGNMNAVTTRPRVAGSREVDPQYDTDIKPCPFCELTIKRTPTGKRMSHTSAGRAPGSKGIGCPGSGVHC